MDFFNCVVGRFVTVVAITSRGRLLSNGGMIRRGGGRLGGAAEMSDGMGGVDDVECT